MNKIKDLKDCYELECDGNMVEKFETGRIVQYSDTDGNEWMMKEKVYQCTKCKEIQVITN